MAFQADSAILTGSDRAWLQDIARTPPAERRAVADSMRSQVEAATDERTLHLLGLGLANLGQFDDARVAFEKSSGTDPSNVVDQVNVAVAMLHVGQLRLARDRPAPIAAGATAVAEVAARMVAEIDRASADAEREIRFTVLRTGFLRERISTGRATVDEQIELARGLISLLRSGHPGQDRGERCASWNPHGRWSLGA